MNFARPPPVSRMSLGRQEHLMPASVPFRVVLTHMGTSGKFFTVFQGKDGSIYIHPYRLPGQPWRVPGGDDPIGERTRLDFADFTERGFELHKISFHPSGYIHLTNKKGERFRDGTKGPPFENMSSPYMLCLLAPPELSLLPPAGNDKGMVVDLVLPDDIGPFYVTLSLAREEVATPPGAHLTLVLPMDDGRRLIIAVRPVGLTAGATSANWPPFPFVRCPDKRRSVDELSSQPRR